MRLFLIMWIAAVCACAQTPPDTVIRTTAQEVLLDLVVRDRRANLVRDLKPEEVEVYEDGVKQTIRVFRSFTDKAQLDEETTAEQLAAAGQASAKGRTLNPMRQVNLVSLVFNSMGPRSRDFARDAALELLLKEIGPNTFIAVFSLDNRLNVLQQFTSDKALLRKAVERVATGTYSQFAQESSKILNQIQSALVLTEAGIATTVDPVAVMLNTPSAATAGAETGVTEANQMIARILYGQSLMGVADVEGMRVVEALKLMVMRHEPLPGRKTVLLFSEGLVLPSTNLQMFQNTIAAANRANVSIYGMDVRGLSTELSSAGSTSQLQNAARLSQRRQTESGDNFRPEDFKQEEMISASFKANYQQNLAELAEGTGGFLIANTNDLRKPLAQLMEDVRTHYELSYSPTSSNYDGKFRKIEVKLKRPGLKVQTRNGYYALPKLAGATIEPFEMAALSAINARPLPAKRPYRASALRLRGDAQFSRYAINFEVPIADLMVTNSADGKTARIHVSMLALIKDDTGQVVRKVSRDVYVDVPQDRLAAYRQGNVTYGQQVYLAGGRYTLETAVVDHAGSASAARLSALVVPQSVQLLSHITLVRRVEPVTERDAADPLQYSAGKVIPALSDRLKSGMPVALYMLVNPEKDGGAAVLSIQLMKDGVEVANETPALDQADTNGIIPYMMSANLNPGTYDVRAIVRQGRKVSEERAAFTVEP